MSEQDAPALIAYPDGTVMASNDGTPIRVTVEGGGFTDAERDAITADLLAGRIKPLEVPPGDGSKITVSFTSGTPAHTWDLAVQVVNGRVTRTDLLYGDDPCPVCGMTLYYDEVGEEREPEIIHPDPGCGWRPDGYPSTRRGWEHGSVPEGGGT